MNHQMANDKITSQMSLSERADHLEEQMMHELDRVITKSVFSHLTDGKVAHWQVKIKVGFRMEA